jgi:UDP-3-O-[3-hydroxymyristoyl] glucosamine N-acyltransferase
MARQYSLCEIAEALGGHVLGDGKVLINKVASVANAQAGDISFINDSKYQKALANSKASAWVLREKDANLTDLPRIIVDNPYAYFAKISALLNPVPKINLGVAESAIVADSATIPDSCSVGELAVIGNDVVLGDNVIIGHGCVIESGVTIADNVRLEPNVTIKHHCHIGKNCNIFSGAIIGSDGFGYAEENGVWLKIPQVGRVIIQDDVDIGGKRRIYRGALVDTIIEVGVRLENLIEFGDECRSGAD